MYEVPLHQFVWHGQSIVHEEVDLTIASELGPLLIFFLCFKFWYLNKINVVLWFAGDKV